MTRVGFLALQAPGLSPSQRYRVEAFGARLAARGITLRYDWVLDAEDLRAFYGRGNVAGKAMVAARAAIRRLGSIARARDVDVWLVQREAFFLGGAWSEWLAGLSAPVVFDFDDAIWIRATSAANARFARLKNVDKVATIVGRARSVVAGNEYLAAWARLHSPSVVVVPTCVDTDVFAPDGSRRRDAPVTIAWSGSASTVAHLAQVLPVLERVQARYGERVKVRVMGDPAFAHQPLGLRGEAWSQQSEMALLRTMDIGLMPLPDDEWTRGKCGLKGLVSMAMGAASVMSPVGVNNEIVEPGVNGFLPSSADEWYDVLCRLIDNPRLRGRVGAAGRQTVVDHYSVAQWEGTLAATLLRAAAT
ncbi:MAG: glycosyltransferase family 4 protein [Acidobacteria bacterium]|nr:glycosyltransferase family 4 protein [Acidobacteriota bacterium]